MKTQRGPHFILVSSQFDKSPNGLMLTKLQKRLNDEVKKEPVVYRFTQRHQVAATECRPSTSPAVMTTTDLSTPAVDSFPTSSSPSAKRKSKSESSSECAKTSDSSASDDRSTKKSTTHDSSTEPELDWSDVAIFRDENSPISDENSPRQSQELQDPSVLQTYLPLPKGAVKGLDFLWRRGAKLEGIQETLEEENEKPTGGISPSSVMSTASKSITPKTTEDPLKKTNRIPVVKIILPETELYPANNKVDEIVGPCESGDAKDAATDRSDDELISSWLKGHKKVKQYPWIQDIIRNDRADGFNQQLKKVNFRHLAKRGDGLVSRELQQRLMKGL